MRLILSAIFLSLVFVSNFGFASMTSMDPYVMSAEALYLEQHPMADLQDQAVQSQIGFIESELHTLFSKVLTPKGQKSFFRMLPWIPGEMMVTVDDTTYRQLLSQATAEPVPAGQDPFFNRSAIDLTQVKMQSAEWQSALEAIGATKMEFQIRSFFIVRFDERKNAAAVVKAFRDFKLSGVTGLATDYAFNNNTPLFRKEVPAGVDYSLALGWGDCMAGCINHHVETFELSAGGAVKHLSTQGDPLPAEMDGLFIESELTK